MRNLLHHFVTARASRIVRLPANMLIAVITLYQHTLSPDHGPLRHLHTYGYCRHSPTCSVYAKEQIRERGAVIGGMRALRRVLTCHPFAKPSDKRLLEVASRL